MIFMIMLIIMIIAPIRPRPIDSVHQLANYHLPAHSFGTFFQSMAKISSNEDVLKIAEAMVIHFDFDKTQCE